MVRIKKRTIKKKKSKTDTKKNDWNKYVRREERCSDEESDQE